MVVPRHQKRACLIAAIFSACRVCICWWSFEISSCNITVVLGMRNIMLSTLCASGIIFLGGISEEIYVVLTPFGLVFDHMNCERGHFPPRDNLHVFISFSGNDGSDLINNDDEDEEDDEDDGIDISLSSGNCSNSCILGGRNDATVDSGPLI